MKTFLLLILLLLNCSFNASEIKNIPSSERQALYDFYYSTDGNNWIYREGIKGHWDFTDPNVNPCFASNLWQGLNCTTPTSSYSDESYHISQINLVNYNLDGTIHYTIGNLSYLQVLNLSVNSLYGNIPKSINMLSNLTKLGLAVNYLSGTLPQLANLTQLKYFNACKNSFNGVIPDMIGKLSDLIELDFSLNSFDGTIPSSLYDLSKLKYFSVLDNHLEGTISNLLGKLSNLNYLNLIDNKFDGTIPYTIGNLTELEVFTLARNKFTGTIPDSVRLLSYVKTFIFDSNYITGTIPSWIDELPYLQAFSVGLNELTGTIPSSIVHLQYLNFINIDYNYLTGSIPENIGNLKFTTFFFLNNNQLNGTIPISLCEMKYMSIFTINNNLFTGTIPDCVGEFKLLTALDVGANSFTGTIPSTLAFNKLNHLTVLRFSYNLLTGTVPNLFTTNITRLAKIDLNDNLLFGTIPQSMSKIQNLSQLLLQNNRFVGKISNSFNGSLQTSLKSVHLSNNQFTGTLPNQVFLSKSLISFSAVSNCFHGSIPSSICDNIHLETLALDGLACSSSCQNKLLKGISDSYISKNQITGGIPDCLWTKSNLTLLHLSGNGLTGTLPSNISTSLIDLSLSYNYLSGNIPTKIQERVWNNLDLSNNHISGTLYSNYEIQRNSSSLSLNQNRISGFIPKNLKNMNDIKILAGNYYDCEYDRSDLPANDEKKDTYQCGSNDFNVLYYIWLGLTAIMIVFTSLLFYYKKNMHIYVNISRIYKKLWMWIQLMDYLEHSNNEIDKEYVDKIKNMEYLKQFYSINIILERFSIYNTIVLLLVVLPVYIILSVFYSTHTYEYAWSVSILYLTGKLAFAISFSVVFLYLFTQIYIYVYSVKNSSYNNKLNLLDEQKQEYRDRIDHSRKSNKWKLYSVYFLYLMINLVVIGGFNIAYVYLVLSQTSDIIAATQIILSIIKIIWNNLISPKMIRSIIDYLTALQISENRLIQKRLFVLQFSVSLLNNIIIPCIIVLIISPNCLYNVFIPQTEVTSSFDYTYCKEVTLIFCTSYEHTKYKTSYTPPFTYSYQCSADFITYYAPVFMYICILTTFVIPLIRLSVFQLSKRHMYISKYFQKWLLELNNPVLATEFIRIEAMYDIFVSELILIAILLTFGAVFPPLAVAVLITILSRKYYQIGLIGRCVLNTLEAKSYSYLDIIEKDFKTIPLLSTIRQCCWILLFVCSLFYSVFLFDILGDDVGVDKAYWVFIVMPCLVLCTYVVYQLHKCYYDSKNNNQVILNNISNKHNSVDGIELASSGFVSLNPLNCDDNDKKYNNENNNTRISSVDLNCVDRDGNSIFAKYNSYEYRN